MSHARPSLSDCYRTLRLTPGASEADKPVARYKALKEAAQDLQAARDRRLFLFLGGVA